MYPHNSNAQSTAPKTLVEHHKRARNAHQHLERGLGNHRGSGDRQGPDSPAQRRAMHKVPRQRSTAGHGSGDGTGRFLAGHGCSGSLGSSAPSAPALPAQLRCRFLPLLTPLPRQCRDTRDRQSIPQLQPLAPLLPCPLCSHHFKKLINK